MMMKLVGLLFLSFGILNTNAQNNDIFNGGSDDGWAKENFLQSSINIFTGNHGDGWSNSSFTQQGNSIFNGGSGDGWDFNSFSQQGNNIFFGGAGDGWHHIYRPLGPLPVTWIQFSATKQNKTALLKWSTATEQNTAYFQIERRGNIGAFFAIGTVSATGNSHSAMEYSFIDFLPEIGPNFYRIKQVDVDNRATYTPVRVVNFNGSQEASLFVYPVPAKDRLWVAIPDIFNDETIKMMIWSIEGKIMKQEQLRISESGMMYEINIASLPAGNYFIIVVSQHRKFSVKFIKQ
ncbi:MAG: T9SS type A sorting domain-containing protein [Ferruginibacter sp.]|nr:T9SS type A sorting domain-containing protein [Ferruginibacter sp.]